MQDANNKFKSETSKYRSVTSIFCQGAGIDIGASGDPVVPTAITIDLPVPYCPPLGTTPTHIPLDGRALTMLFASESLDYVYSSHLLEDFSDWESVVLSWASLVRVHGNIIILVPDKERWQKALANGQPPNDAHQHEFTLGELRGVFEKTGHWHVIYEFLGPEDDYGLVFIARRIHSDMEKEA